MKVHFYLKLSIQIITIFMIMIFVSFIPDYFHVFFGDIYCLGNIGKRECIDGWMNTHGADWHWGYRHFIWAIMGIVLFIVQVIRIIDFVDKKTN